MKELYPGDQGIWVQYLQLALQRAGQQVMLDGIFGPKTCAAVEKVMGSSGKCAVKEAQWNRLLPFLRGYITHEVKAGDTFFSIAKMYDTTMERVMHANPGTDAGALQIGSTVVVPLSFPLVSGEVPYTSLLTGWIIEGLQARYPYLQVGTIGRSVMGTPLWSLQLGNGPVEVGYNASFHANESITTPVLLKFAERLLEAYADERMYEELYPERLFEEYSLYLVPLVNPDGVDLVNGLLTEGFYYRRAVRIASGFPDIPFPDGWKANIQGVDLNLQFPAGWDMAKKIKFEQGYNRPAPRDYVGQTPLSVPESIAMFDFTRNHDFSLILAYHTQGEVIYWKYLDEEPEGARRIAEYFAKVSGYRIEETPAASGYAGYKDWFINFYDRPGYTIEAEIRPEYRHFKGALAAARQGDEVNPEKRSSGEQFYLVQGKTYTDQELDQIEKRKWLAAKNQLGDRLFKPLQEEFQRYKKTGQYQKADSLLRYVNEEIEKQYAENPYKMSPETREMYKSVGGTPFLDGDYTVFGEIVEGMDVLEKIALVATDSNDRPKEDVIILGTKLKRK